MPTHLVTIFMTRPQLSMSAYTPGASGGERPQRARLTPGAGQEGEAILAVEAKAGGILKPTARAAHKWSSSVYRYNGGWLARRDRRDAPAHAECGLGSLLWHDPSQSAMSREIKDELETREKEERWNMTGARAVSGGSNRAWRHACRSRTAVRACRELLQGPCNGCILENERQCFL
jgi:hypothetical protein